MMIGITEAEPSSDKQISPPDFTRSGGEAVEFRNAKQEETPEERRKRIQSQSIARQNLRLEGRYSVISGFTHIATGSYPGVDGEYKLISTSDGRVTYVPSSLAKRYRQFCSYLTSIPCTPKQSEENHK